MGGYSLRPRAGEGKSFLQVVADAEVVGVGRRHTDGIAEVDGGKGLRAIARRVALRLRVQRAEDLLGSHRHLVDPDAEGVVDGGVEGGNDRQQGTLAGL